MGRSCIKSLGGSGRGGDVVVRAEGELTSPSTGGVAGNGERTTEKSGEYSWDFSSRMISPSACQSTRKGVY